MAAGGNVVGAGVGTAAGGNRVGRVVDFAACVGMIACTSGAHDTVTVKEVALTATHLRKSRLFIKCSKSFVLRLLINGRLIYGLINEINIY